MILPMDVRIRSMVRSPARVGVIFSGLDASIELVAVSTVGFPASVGVICIAV